MKTRIIIVVLCMFTATHSYSQGCIIVRNISGFGQYNLSDNSFTTSAWQLNIINRYFKSFRDYAGSINQHTPAKNKNEISSYSTDFTLSRFFDHGWSLDLDIPILANTRTTAFEHAGLNTPRYATHAFGLGDIRLMVYKWLLRPSVSKKFNIQIGLGLKLPTGDYRYTDYFHRDDTTKVLAPVNPAIQLGDGGTGITTELNSYYFFSKKVSIYANFYYLINPKDQNGVSTTFGRTPTVLQMQSGNAVATVADVFSIRAGFIYDFKKIALSAGYRQEGVPVYDLVGGSDGLRRPGYNISVEPGIIYKMKKVSLYGYIPIAIAHRINQSVPDKIVSQKTGVYTRGYGGSGDYQLFAGATFKLY
jgi:hypothetical protein